MTSAPIVDSAMPIVVVEAHRSASSSPPTSATRAVAAVAHAEVAPEHAAAEVADALAAELRRVADHRGEAEVRRHGLAVGVHTFGIDSPIRSVCAGSMSRTARLRGIRVGNAREPSSKPKKLADAARVRVRQAVLRRSTTVFADVDTPSLSSKLVGNELVSIDSVPPPNCPGRSAE